ncbi:MAG: toprim domain-containing protein [Candidatus Thiodiazotropha endolucinida]|nr:toprim domain-containing protein [Candidatus Thiodiazotropha taylori]MCW4347284.1 toprim domain-containing protein [Candidatus Thiodiazotropha endolucinida]
MDNNLFDFRSAIQSAGLEPPNHIVPGTLHRFPGNNKKSGNRAGWCLYFEDGLGGCFGDWSSGISETWHAKYHKPYSSTERATYARRMKEIKKLRNAQLKLRQVNAAKRAAKIWKAATSAPSNHPYLILKHIHPHGARIYKGMITLPVMDFINKITSLQFISKDGNKLLLSGGRKGGCFIPVSGNITSHSRVILCEGWATGCTLAEDDPTAMVMAAIDAGNLEPVALAVRHRWPSTEIVIAGDDDRLTAGNPGATKAKAAARASGALLALPEWPEDAPEHLTDFNDLIIWLAGDEV